MHGIKPDLPAVGAPTRMQIAAAVGLSVYRRDEKPADFLDLIVLKPHDFPMSEELPIPISVAGNEFPVGRIKAMSVEMHLIAAQLMNLLFLANREFDVRVDAVLPVGGNNHRARIAL